MAQKPRILCFHGLGSNSEIFQAQTYQLRRRLEPYFELVYPNGPYEAEPGPGILPVFEGCGPYYRWTRDNEDAYDKDEYDHSGFDRSEGLRMVLDKLDPPISSPVWVGVLGFSHGGRVSAGILKQQSLRSQLSQSDDDEILSKFTLSIFKFGVFFHSAYPPLEFPVATLPEYRDCIISVPSIHIHGLKDPSLRTQQLLVPHFQTEKRIVIESPVGHWLPNTKKDIDLITEKILALYGSKMKEIDAVA